MNKKCVNSVKSFKIIEILNLNIENQVFEIQNLNTKNWEVFEVHDFQIKYCKIYKYL